MRKLLSTMIALAIAGFFGTAMAVDGDFEMSGHVNTGMGYQYWGKNADSGLIGASGSSHGTLGDFPANSSGGTKLARQQSLIGFVDEAEIDVMKSFGENVRARVDFVPAAGADSTGSGAIWTGNGGLEQAYATVNIPVGNGMEFLVGRFDVPIGYESVERNDNTLFSHTTIYRDLRPKTATGLKFYYPFSDMVDLHFYVVNNLTDTFGGTDFALPSGGFRLGFGWGDMGRRSTFGVSAAGGMEAFRTSGAAGKNGNLSYMADLDWNVWVSEYFAVGGEGVFRSDSANAAATDGRYFGGTLALNYVFSDVWDGTLRYTFVMDKAGISGTTACLGSCLSVISGGSAGKTTVHEVALGGQYHIADGAKLQLEARYDMLKNTALAGSSGSAYGGALAFLYTF
ncbi:MAG: outer membrane beta-barrel protein [Deltaproteobacteria bacterium]|nr:outer membrane beta-barrel protein [Deltaproteobacteria bacterium]